MLTSEIRGESRSSSARTLNILAAFAGSRPILGVSELAAKTGVPKSTTHRILSALVDFGYVRRVGDRYSLAEPAFVLGNGLWACRPGGFREQAIPHMIDLSGYTKGTVHLAIPDGSTSIIHIEKIFAKDCPPCPSTIGSRRPTHCTALGKALLAFSAESALASLAPRLRRFTPGTRTTVETLAKDLQRVRHAGVATDFEEFQTGVCCVAVPIVDHRNRIAVGALSICATPDRMNVKRFSAYLLRAAETLSQNASTRAVMPASVRGCDEHEN